MWNFGNLGVGDSVPVISGQLVASMAVTVMKVFCQNLLIILNLSASQILPMLISGTVKRSKNLSEGTVLSSTEPVFVELHDLQVCISKLKLGVYNEHIIHGCSHLSVHLCLLFTARCYASAVLAMGLCPSVCVCVCLSVCHKPVFY